MKKDNQLKDALKKSLRGHTAKGVKVESVEFIAEISVYRYKDDDKIKLDYLDVSEFEKGDGGFFTARIRGTTDEDGLQIVSNYQITNGQFKINGYRNDKFSIELGTIYDIRRI